MAWPRGQPSGRGDRRSGPAERIEDHIARLRAVLDRLFRPTPPVSSTGVRGCASAARPPTPYPGRGSARRCAGRPESSHSRSARARSANPSGPSRANPSPRRGSVAKRRSRSTRSRTPVPSDHAAGRRQFVIGDLVVPNARTSADDRVETPLGWRRLRGSAVQRRRVRP